jgi:hypothetical protein
MIAIIVGLFAGGDHSISSLLSRAAAHLRVAKDAGRPS